MVLGVQKSIGRIGPRRAAAASSAPAVRVWHARTSAQNWTVDIGGVWKFYVWGPGAAGSTDSTDAWGGGSGALAIISKRLAAGDVVAVRPSFAGTNSTVTFPNGAVVTGGAASGVTGGTASGGDVNINGSTGGTNAAGSAGGGTDGGAGFSPGSAGYAGGAGAPGYDGLRGGDAGITTGGSANVSTWGGEVGAGSGINISGGVNGGGGPGMVIAIRQRA